MDVGKPSQCFRRGFGAGFHREVKSDEMDEFIADFAGPYEKLVNQPLFYGDGPVPAGKIRATLSQCMQRGYGVGSMQRAKEILKERGTRKEHGKQKFPSNAAATQRRAAPAPAAVGR